MRNVLDVLSSRGFIEKTTHDDELRQYLGSEKATCYIGFDPTASSLHVGSLVPIMSLAHMQRNGHRPIALVGGGTGLVGDPSGKTEMRQLLTEADVAANVVGLKKQFETAKYEVGQPVAYIATIQEYGSAQNGIPPRPFMRKTISEQTPEWKGLLASRSKAILAGNETTESVIDKIGMFIIEIILKGE